ncbi:Hsp70 protein [Klebsiella oxytoca]|uniref:Hsp70 protein n=1 Tax=Klebsiella oxytoca TaxID=571 RepID=A0A318FXD6_KLEOX|nr:Hsp70 protein [Klebsiella oxytoca]HCB1500706.1 Hsp70 family protein [Klebsiella michiganensis]HCB1846871.1 Hsp70 family protein [Klebsiella oxytoca]
MPSQHSIANSKAQNNGLFPLSCMRQHQERLLEISWPEDELGALWLPLLNRRRAPIEQSLRDSLLTPEQIDSLVLVDGASQHALVQRIAVRLFGKMPYKKIHRDFKFPGKRRDRKTSFLHTFW